MTDKFPSFMSCTRMCLCLVEFLLFERAATKGGNLMLSPRDMISHGSGVGSVTYRKKHPTTTVVAVSNYLLQFFCIYNSSCDCDPWVKKKQQQHIMARGFTAIPPAAANRDTRQQQCNGLMTLS